MLNQIQLNDIKSQLENGEEVTITCENLKRLVEIEKQTYDFPGKLRIRLIA